MVAATSLLTFAAVLLLPIVPGRELIAWGVGLALPTTCAFIVRNELYQALHHMGRTGSVIGSVLPVVLLFGPLALGLVIPLAALLLAGLCLLVLHGFCLLPETDVPTYERMTGEESPL